MDNLEQIPGKSYHMKPGMKLKLRLLKKKGQFGKSGIPRPKKLTPKRMGYDGY